MGLSNIIADDMHVYEDRYTAARHCMMEMCKATGALGMHGNFLSHRIDGGPLIGRGEHRCNRSKTE